MLHLQRGTPFIYQGEELGMTNAPFDDVTNLRDIESLNYIADAVGARSLDAEEALAAVRQMGRDNARTPMQWDGSSGAGFSSAEPWLGVNPNAAVVNAASQAEDPDSVFSFYRRLIELRHTDPLVTFGDFELLAPEHPQLFAYMRRYQDEQLLVLANFGTSELALEGLVDAQGELLVGNYPPGSAALRPWEVRVLRKAPHPRP